MSEKFDIYSKIFFRDVGNFFRYLCELVLRHQMRVSNYFVNSFYSAGQGGKAWFSINHSILSGHIWMRQSLGPSWEGNRAEPEKLLYYEFYATLAHITHFIFAGC